MAKDTMTLSLDTFCTFFLYSAISLLNIHAFASEVCHFPAIFNFGASNSDTGGFAAAFIQPKSPNGETFFRMPAGRLCDGRLIIDFTSMSLGLPFLSSYLNSLASNFSHGANFATVGSTIRLPTERIIPSGRASPFYLRIQYLQFAQFKARSQIIRAKGGPYPSLMPREENFAKALYTFDIGQNDLVLSLNTTATELNANVPDIVNQFIANIKNIYSLGGRSFWVYNTRPIGCLPDTLTIFPAAEKDSAGCAKPFNQLAQHYNMELKKALAEVRTELPLATIIYVDIYSALYPLYTSPAKFGFQLPLVACCGYGGQYNYSRAATCGETINVNGTNITVGSCQDTSVRVNWDGLHFTEAANKFVFDRVSTGAFCDPPIPLKQACHPSRTTANPT